MKRSLVLCAVLALAAGCSGSEATTDPTSVGVTAAGPSTEPATTEPATTEPATTEPTTTEPTTTEPAVTGPPVTSPLADVEPITVEATTGDRPLFSWTPVDGAREYTLVVATTGGDVIWAWRGRDTQVDLGAGLIAGDEGPRLTTESVIDVLALAADGTIIAASGPVPLSP